MRLILTNKRLPMISISNASMNHLLLTLELSKIFFDAQFKVIIDNKGKIDSFSYSNAPKVE